MTSSMKVSKPLTVRDFYEMTEEQFRDLPISVDGYAVTSLSIVYPDKGKPSHVILNKGLLL